MHSPVTEKKNKTLITNFKYVHFINKEAKKLNFKDLNL